MTPQEREVLRMALEFIERVNKDGWILADFEPQMYAVMTAINEVLAQPEQIPPSAYSNTHQPEREQTQPELKDEKGRPMTYWGGMAQPQRTWVGLTDEDYDLLSDRWWKPNESEQALIDWVIERLKEKNT